MWKYCIYKPDTHIITVEEYNDALAHSTGNLLAYRYPHPWGYYVCDRKYQHSSMGTRIQDYILYHTTLCSILIGVAIWSIVMVGVHILRRYL